MIVRHCLFQCGRRIAARMKAHDVGASPHTLQSVETYQLSGVMCGEVIRYDRLRDVSPTECCPLAVYMLSMDQWWLLNKLDR